MHLASVVALVAPLAAVSAQAIIAQPSGLEYPARVIDFGSGLFPDGTPISAQFAGLTISHASYFTTAAINNVAGGFLANDLAAGPPDTLRIQFAQYVADVSFVYHQIGAQGPSTVRALFQGNIVDSFQIQWNASQPNNFFGFLETSVDELQIDFVGDFRLDDLAFNPVGGGACYPYNGSNVNPAGFGCVTRPVLGETWQATVWNTPETVLTALVWAPAGLGSPVPLFGGELLLDTSQPLVTFTGGATYSLAVPGHAAWIGFRLALQAVRLEVHGGAPVFVPMNAMLLIFGL